MTSQERIAIARIITDLIKADDILDLSEMKLFREIREKYRIGESHLVAAQKIDFGTAVDILKQLEQSEMAAFFNDMKSITIADGYCCPEEAFLILALRYCLGEECVCKLITTDVTDICIEKGNVVYIESAFDDEANAFISDNYRSLTNDFRLAGLEFVYIPHIAKDFSSMNDEYLQDIVSFLAPMLSEDSRKKVFETLRTITTKDFCDDFLVKKMGLNDIFDTEPSLLLQVSRTDSKIVYLQIFFNDDIRKEIESFVDGFRELTSQMPQSNYALRISNYALSNRFIYHGFHKSLFDILAFPGQKVESRILIDLLKRRIVFLDLGEEISLPPMQLAQYVFIIHQTLCSRTHELPARPASEKRMEILNKMFNRIYGLMDGNADTDYNRGLAPNLSHIKNAISSLERLDNMEAYLPEKTEDKTFRVRIKPTNVFVMENGQQILMTDSEKWINL